MKSKTELVSAVVRDVRVPADLVGDAERFGGTLNGDCLGGDLLIRDGAVVGLISGDQVPDGVKVLDGGGRLVIPRLVEPHCHLDKCHTIARLGPVGGDLMAAGAAQKRDKINWTKEDIRTRAERGLRELCEAGCGVVRTHVDWTSGTTEAPTAWSVICELAQEWADRMTVQVAALIDLDAFGEGEAGVILAKRISDDGGVLGAFVLGHEDPARKLDEVFRLAEKFGLAVDFHVDETLDGAGDGLDHIAAASLRSGFSGPVLCGHACSLMNRQGDELSRALDAVERAGLSIAALPATNLYLQCRTGVAPERRGMAPVLALRDAGINVVFGSDNVCDAFCPTGRHDPMHALALGALVGHLDPPYGPWLRTVTAGAAKAVGVTPVTVDTARLENLLISDALHTFELVAGTNGSPRPLLSVFG